MQLNAQQEAAVQMAVDTANRKWADVFLHIESSLAVMPEEERVRWLYTATTRSKENVYLC